MHADHHLGALRLIAERRVARARLGLPPVPVLVVGPSKMAVWLLEAARVDPSLGGPGSWVFADAEHFLHYVRRGVDIDLHLPPPPVCAMAVEEEAVAAAGAAAEAAREPPAEDAAEVLPDAAETGMTAPAAKRARSEESAASVYIFGLLLCRACSLNKLEF
jgi:hypothetical protein